MMFFLWIFDGFHPSKIHLQGKPSISKYLRDLIVFFCPALAGQTIDWQVSARFNCVFVQLLRGKHPIGLHPHYGDVLFLVTVSV